LLAAATADDEIRLSDRDLLSGPFLIKICGGVTGGAISVTDDSDESDESDESDASDASDETDESDEITGAFFCRLFSALSAFFLASHSAFFLSSSSCLAILSFLSSSKSIKSILF